MTQRLPRCFYCDTVLSFDTALLNGKYVCCAPCWDELLTRIRPR